MRTNQIVLIVEKVVANIKTYLEKGNTIKTISRKVGIPYYTVYRFCKSKGLLSNSTPTKTDIIKTNHDKIVEMLRQFGPAETGFLSGFSSKKSKHKKI